MGSPNVRDLLAAFAVIEMAKEAVRRFEDGEINAFDALELIRHAATLSRAA